MLKQPIRNFVAGLALPVSIIVLFQKGRKSNISAKLVVPRLLIEGHTAKLVTLQSPRIMGMSPLQKFVDELVSKQMPGSAS
ncbi:MAG TPA: hypothetical protein VLA49_03405 [Anaerolineales bacterium]|nr:hypothetical protein [Anaerolineales bacterium]